MRCMDSYREMGTRVPLCRRGAAVATVSAVLGVASTVAAQVPTRPAGDVRLTEEGGDNSSYLDLAHLAVQLRYLPPGPAGFDIGIRGGIGNYCPDTGSCEFNPGLYGGTTLAILAGGRHWRVGPRVVVARVGDQSRPSWTEAWIVPLNVWYLWAR